MKSPSSRSGNVRRGQLQKANQTRKPPIRTKRARSDSLVASLDLERRRVKDNAAVRRFVGDELAGSGLLDVLPKREQIIIVARFGLDGGKPKTLEEIGKQFGITRERIRQLQNAALSKLSRARGAMKWYGNHSR
ncbi:MAG TPA: sigma factor-like helix-turn-helix DNA-binding protein [Candidatus Binatia bacterium]|jgi:RNA polymerase sigma factor (sigma-70 family)|nr:sigma factor-like helix-turn-helix DNA-binding protein [Candidatus Binatia bacterium]